MQLPWYSNPDDHFPPKAQRQRRRRREQPAASEPLLELPTRDDTEQPDNATESKGRTVTAPSEQETPATSQAHSEADSTHPTTPSSALLPSTPQVQAASGHSRKATIPAVPLVPIKPTIPASQRKGSMTTSAAERQSTAGDAPQESGGNAGQPVAASPESERTATAVSPPPKAIPKSWADLVRTKNAAAAAAAAAAPASGSSGASTVNGFAAAKSDSMVDVLRTYDVNAANKLAFLEPRGLVNTGNMCYMNSVSQLHSYCLPYLQEEEDTTDEYPRSFKLLFSVYHFTISWIRWASERRTVSKARHRCLTLCKFSPHFFFSGSAGSDAYFRIMFMREFPVIDSAISQEQLRLRLKDTELEQYGDAFTPEFVYDVIKRLPRFAHMRVCLLTYNAIAYADVPSVVTNKTRRSFWVSFWLDSMMNASMS